jgi:hypothetical protein
MDSLSPALDDILDRGRDTSAVMDKLAAAPHNWKWSGVSPQDFAARLVAVDGAVTALAGAETALTEAAADWDTTLDGLVQDAAFGLRLARVRYKEQPVKLRLFEGLRLESNGRDAKSQFALNFEASWERAEPTWVFKPAVTLDNFSQRRESIFAKQKLHVAAEKNEQHERAALFQLAEQLNVWSVDWYEVATATFAADTVAGQLVRTVPTTYDPNRPPSALVFLQRLSPAPSQVQLTWRAARGERYYLSAQRPGAGVFEVMLDGVTDTDWRGQGLSGGLWRFKGYAANQHGPGPESGLVEVTVAVAAAA